MFLLRRLRDDIRQQADQIINLQSRLKETQVTLADSQSKELPMQYDLLKAQREHESLASRLNYAESEAGAKAGELLALRREYSAEVLNLKSQITALTNESKTLDERLKSAKDAIALMDEKHLQDIAEIRDLKILTGDQQAKLVSELDATKRQAQLYMGYFDENAETIKQLEDTLSTTRSSFTAQLAALKDKLKSNQETYTIELKAEKDKFTVEVTDLKAKLAAVEEQLRAAESTQPQRSTRQVAVIDPADADNGFTSLSEFEGLGAVEMYAKVVDTEKALAAERRRAGELEYFLQRIQRELESKAPMIEATRRDHRRLLESHERLAKRLDAALTENNALKSAKEEGSRAVSEALANAAALEQQNKDLSEQLQHLLFTNFQKAHGSRILSSPADRNQTAPGAVVKSADDVISEHLLTYDDIMELQTRNAQLVKVIRRLSADQESAVAKLNAMNQGGAGLGTQSSAALENALKELNSLKESRQRMEDMVATLVQQRDVLRAMLEESDRSSAADHNSLAIMPASAADSAVTPGKFGTPAGTPGRLVASSPIARQLETRLSEVCVAKCVR